MKLIKIKDNEHHIGFYNHYAFLPTKTTDGGWRWLMDLYLVEDERPVEYLGLFPDRTYFVYEDGAARHYRKLLSDYTV